MLLCIVSELTKSGNTLKKFRAFAGILFIVEEFVRAADIRVPCKE
jgi:hypothetical protein